MGQISYGTITITDTNDIERIYMVYAGSSSDTAAPDASNFNLWKTDITQVSGDYIWQRTVVKKSGITITSSNFQEYYGDPVCITGPEGAAGEPARKITKVTPYYYLSTSSSGQTGGSWSDTPAAYPNTGTYYYWTKTVTTYDSGSPTESTPVLDKALNSANKAARDANQIASTTQTNLNNYITSNDAALDALQTKTKYFWRNLTTHTKGNDGWTKPNYPVGTYAASGIDNVTFDEEDSSTYGYNTLYANGIKLRYNAINLGQLTGSSLIFYNPSTTSQGAKAMELSGSALKFYASDGATAQAEFGGTKARVSGTIEALDGKIGNNSNNYWYIGNYVDYNQNQSAAIKSYGTAFIQLGDNNTWRLATNRFHSAWNDDSSGTAGQLHYPIYDSKYWDSGLHLPTSSTDKFLYIRNAPNTQSLENLQNDLEDSGYDYWTYQFYIDGVGNLHAGDIYSHDTLISGASAPYLLKSGGTMTGSITMSNGGKFIGNLTGNADTASNASKVNGLTVQTAVPANAIFTDKNVQTSQANTTKIYLTGTSTSGTNTGTLSYDSNVYLTATAGTLHATTFEGNLSGTATKANQDGDGNVIKTTYLKLSGGNVTGPVSFGSSVSVDELTAGDLVVNGAASFTNNLQANTINGVAVGENPKFTDTVTTVTTSGNGNAVTAITAANGKLTVTKGTTFLTSYTETDPIFVASAAHGITSSDISNWNSKTSNTGTVTKVIAGTGLSIGTTAGGNFTTSGTINHTNSVTAQTTQGIYPIKIDAQGHISAYGSAPTTLSGYGITDAVPSSRKIAGHALSSDITLSKSDVGLSNVINTKQITNITNEFKDGQNTGKLVIWRGESDSEVLEVQITAREATSATNATNAQYATYDASEASNTTKTTIANKYIPKSIGTAAGDIIYWSANGTPTRLAKGSNGQFLTLSNGIPAWSSTLVTGVKGNSESSYRTGQVNITATNIGLGNVENKSSATIRSELTSSNVTTALGYTPSHNVSLGFHNDYDRCVIALCETTATNTGINSWSNGVLTRQRDNGLIPTKVAYVTFNGAYSTAYSAHYSLLCNHENTSTDARGTTEGFRACTFTYNNKRYAGLEFYQVQASTFFYTQLAGTFTPFMVPYYNTSSSTVKNSEINNSLVYDTSTLFRQSFDAQTITGHTVGIDVPSTAKFTDTWNALSTSQAGYVSTAPNDTTKFLRGDAAWAQVSSANLSDIRLTWASSVSATDWILAHDTAATGTPLFRAMSPANLKTTMSLNNVENKSSATIRNELTSSNVTTALGYTPVNKAGDTMTGVLNVLANQYTDSYSGALNMNNSNIYGVNSIYTADLSDNSQEGIHFYRTSTTVDTIYAKNGNLYFVPNRTLGSNGTSYTVLHTGNYTSTLNNKYVTIDTDQTITASQKTFNGATRWGTTSKYGAVHYDSSLDAIVFSFA